MKWLHHHKTFIFEDERPFLQCHASTLLRLDNGDILAAWFGGTKEKDPDVAIWISKRNLERWSAPVKVADQEQIPHWNPVLFQKKDGSISLYYKVGHEIPEWKTFVICSFDQGTTWTMPKELVAGDRGGRGPVKNKPIYLQNGTIAAPASIEAEIWDAFVDLSYDNGETWKKSGLIPFDHSSCQGKGIIQPTLWESKPGQVHMLLRSTEGWIFRSDSADSGQNWTPAYPTTLPNNNSGIDLVKMANGSLALVYNPIRENWGKRTPLLLTFSHDNGQTWEDIITLEDGEGEYSYPAIIAHKNQVWITYTWNRERIAFHHISF